MLETTPTGRGGRGELVIQQGELAGRRYSFEAVVCQNPTCDCEHVTLKCFTEMPEAGPTAPVYLEMELERRQIANLEELKTNPSTRALANAVAAECGQEEWNQLRRIYWGLKRYWTEHSDLEQVEVSFPPDAPTGAMIAYFDILTAEAVVWSQLERADSSFAEVQNWSQRTLPLRQRQKWKKCCGA
ncbi:MAG: hypothetical protein WBL63_01245 [Candidatus Acidiferrum sp.]